MEEPDSVWCVVYVRGGGWGGCVVRVGMRGVDGGVSKVERSI